MSERDIKRLRDKDLEDKILGLSKAFNESGDFRTTIQELGSAALLCNPPGLPDKSRSLRAARALTADMLRRYPHLTPIADQGLTLEQSQLGMAMLELAYLTPKGVFRVNSATPVVAATTKIGKEKGPREMYGAFTARRRVGMGAHLHWTVMIHGPEDVRTARACPNPELALRDLGLG